MNSNMQHAVIAMLRFLLIAVVFTFCLGQAHQTVLAADMVYYVTDTAASSGSGLSWDDPVSLSTALLWAKGQLSHRVEIRVAAGIYYPVGASRSATFTVPENVNLYGGYTSDFTSRDWEQNQTVLSGNINQPESADDNSYHVVTIARRTTDQNAVLDGLTIQNGNANGSASDANGGGIWVDYAEPVLDHLIVQNNAAGAQGGGIFIQQARVNNPNLAKIHSSQILNNQAVVGGGLACDGNGLELINSVWYGNRAQQTGGAIALGSDTRLWLTNVSMVNNTAQMAAWAISAPGTSYAFLNNSIVWNSQPANSAFSGALLLTCNHSLLPAASACFRDNPNLDTNPQFIHLPAENQPADLRLQTYSPAINFGDDTKLPVGTTEDLDGNPRKYAEHVDLGAYEAQNVNHAPTLAQTQINLAPATRLMSSQITIHDLIQRIGVSDADGIIGSAGGIAVVEYDNAPGAWEYSLDDGISWQAIGPVSTKTAFLLQDAPGTWLRFRLSGLFSGTASLKLRAWDGTDQRTNASSGVDTFYNGLATSYSVEITTASVPCQGQQIFLPLLSLVK